MSAILPTPTSPTLINLEDLKAFIQSEIEKAVSPLKTKIAYLEAELTEVKAGLLETKELLAISLKRNTQLENAIFTYDSEGEILRDSDNQPVLKAVLATEKPTEEAQDIQAIIPKTSLELKAVSLVDKLRIKPRSRTGEVFLDNSELTKFLTTELPEELRSNDSNLRRVKKKVIEKAKSLFPDSIFINKSKYGRHETRIVLKESYQSNRNGTLV
jgi:hypothetical protein